jgi:hypothetical protein
VIWHFLNSTGKKKGSKAIEKMATSNIDKQVGLTGVFSNLGAWPLKDDYAEMDRHAKEISHKQTWFVSPNITSTVPIGATAMTWFNHLGLTVRIHPCVSDDPKVAEKIAELWREDLLS